VIKQRLNHDRNAYVKKVTGVSYVTLQRQNTWGKYLCESNGFTIVMLKDKLVEKLISVKT